MSECAENLETIRIEKASQKSADGFTSIFLQAMLGCTIGAPSGAIQGSRWLIISWYSVFIGTCNHRGNHDTWYESEDGYCCKDSDVMHHMSLEALQETKPVLKLGAIAESDCERNFTIDRLEMDTFVVRSDSERFGIQSIVFESRHRNECLGYIDARETPIKPTFYVIEDLSTWTVSGIPRSKLERFDTLEDAIVRFKTYENNTYDYTDGKAKLAMGVTIGDNEIDIIHVREEKKHLVGDFMKMKRFNTNSLLLKDLRKIHEMIGFDKVRQYNGSVAEEINFETWVNPYF